MIYPCRRLIRRLGWVVADLMTRSGSTLHAGRLSDWFVRVDVPHRKTKRQKMSKKKNLQSDYPPPSNKKKTIGFRIALTEIRNYRVGEFITTFLWHFWGNFILQMHLFIVLTISNTNLIISSGLKTEIQSIYTFNGRLTLSFFLEFIKQVPSKGS